MPPPTATDPAELAEAHGELREGARFFSRAAARALAEGLDRARAHFRGARLEDASERTASEWLLDNDYLLRRVIGQLAGEFPAGFQRRLPRLASSRRPRALEIAEVLVRREGELDLDALDTFLDAYQRIAPLTLAELWALPVLLRLVVLRDLCETIDAIVAPLPQPGFEPGSAVGRGVRALRMLAEIDVKALFSRHSVVERILRLDPAGAYAAMDFDSRDAYRHAVEAIARDAGRDEPAIARAALRFAGEGPPDGRRDHVGEWLMGAGRRELERSSGARPRGLEPAIRGAPRAWFFGALAVCHLALLAPVLGYLAWLGPPWWQWVVAVALMWIPASVPAVTLVHAAISSVLAPQRLYKLDFSAGVPLRWRTLVAVPTLLGSAEEVDEIVERLAVHYLSNPDEGLSYALLTDHVDTADRPSPAEEALVEHARRGVRALNRRFGSAGRRPFHLLHRGSRYNQSEGRWMGWERKRGKLEELNRWLRGDDDTSYEVHEGEPLEGVAFVLTLDRDTQLPPGAAARLAGALAHPLNRPRVDGDGRVREGYTVIQPRVEISPRSARRSPFTRLFAGDTGIDIYTRAVSEAYQDLFGEGIYVGKGIYDVDGFAAALEDRVPENSLVSHDLFEGIHGRAGLATDVVVYEDYPPHYAAYLHRMHRWIRGDWQLLPWLLPRVPRADGGSSPNPLGVVDRFKILDNLRRSLLAPSLIALLAGAWFWLPGHPLVWTLAALLAPGTGAMLSLLRAGVLPRQELGRWLLALCFAAPESLAVVDAVARVLYRMLVSRRMMLEWTTAARAARSFGGGRGSYLRLLWVGTALAAGAAVTLALLDPITLAWASPILLLWVASPEIAYRISRPTPERAEALDEASRRYLRRVARRTWLFFETFVGPGDQWLPPDHYQEHPRGEVAHRTSPTDIGMALLSQLGAFDLGYVGVAELASRVDSTLSTVEELDKHRGHVLNWFDTETLAPLEPRYVSTVDSGNLAGALLALAVGCEQAVAEPPLRAAMREGLLDAAELLAETVDEWVSGASGDEAEGSAAAARDLVRELSAPERLTVAGLDAAAERADVIEAGLLGALRTGAEVSHDPALLRELRTWLERLGHQLDEARRLVTTLLPGDLRFAPPALGALEEACERVGAHDAARAAAALVGKLRGLAARARELEAAMDFGFLYDPERRLFHIGYDVGADRLDPHHYDLLASEARLASFLAVMRREVPPTHWFALGRPVVSSSAGPVLLSWGGSMFEYLMPSLLMRSHRDTLLERSCEAAVSRQIERGRELGVPWGTSESGYAFLDGQQAYQYRSFGVPGLGLRRGLEEDVVVAPYASLLAVSLRPREVVDNLRALEALGMRGRYGFFEAADFHPERVHGDRVAIVREYMSHHHGMSLVAIVNHLRGDAMVERFHADPRVESVALLLDERAPRAAPREPPREEVVPSGDVGLTPQAALGSFEPPAHARAAWALGNGATTAIVTADGGGGLSWRDLALTRWRPDPVREPWGPWIYLVDLDDGALFGAAPAPLDGWPEDGRVRFGAGSVEMLSRRGRLTVRLRVAVAAGEDVEVRQLRISNEGDAPRRLRVVGCVEPVLEPRRAAERHPAFGKLFLRAQPDAELGGFLVSRVTRDGAPAPVMAHRMVGDARVTPRPLTVDRRDFLGRGRDYRDPLAVREPPEPGATVASLDPVCATVGELVVEPGTSRELGFVTAVAPTRAAAKELARRFGSARSIRWAIEDADHAGGRRAARAGMSPALMPAAARVLGALLAPEPSLRAPTETLARGRPSPPSLWGRSISGDEPIWLLRLRGPERTELLDDALRVHRYLRALGLRVDLVIIDDAPSGYGDEGARAWSRLLAQHDMQHLLHQRGGVHVVRADQTGGQDLLDLEAAAAVWLDGRDGGGLVERLGEPAPPRVELPRFAPAGPPPGAPSDPEVEVAVPPDLEHDNGLGGFDGDEYVIRPGAPTPAPWCNVLANPAFGCLVSDGGLGSTWSLNAGENRLTPWHNDPVTDPPSEVLYLRDEETGRIWSTTPRPLGPPALVRHGAGYTTYELACEGLEQTMTVFVPPERPVKIARLTIRNAGERPRRLTATYYAEWVLGPRREDCAPHVRSEAVPESCCLLATGSWSIDFAGRVAFLASDRPTHGYTADRLEVLGRGGDPSRPEGLSRWGLSGRTDPAADACAALQVHIDLRAGETVEVSFFLGQSADRAAALALVGALRAPGAVEAELAACRRSWDERLDAVRVRTPIPAMDRLLNRWLLYQSIASRFFGRTALYQSSGAFGFRDQLQDSLALLHVEPALTRAHLLESAAHQLVEGDVLHWWHPPGGAGVRTRCSDDLLWLVFVTAAYVEWTGDESILVEEAPFLAADALRPGDEARYGRFPEAGRGTLLEHCRRALARGSTAGPRGLPLIGDGDWNDGMNRVGPEGRGESVWLGWFLHACTTRFAALLNRVGETEEARRWRARLPALERALEEHGWDGGWYRRAFFDDGRPVGSAHSRPPHIDSISQSWAAISGAGDPGRVELALAAAERLLVREDDRLVLLLSPPFGRTGPDAGYIGAYPPGVRENGGQYTHAAAWLGWAHAARGDGASAARILDLLNPIARPDIERYRVEPYVIAADVYGCEPFVGRGGWTWYTGAAAWTWRLGVEAILGLRREGGALVVDPCIPPGWEGYEAWVREGDLTVHVVVDNRSGAGHGVGEVRLDGRRVAGARVELGGSGTRRLDVTLAEARTEPVSSVAG